MVNQYRGAGLRSVHGMCVHCNVDGLFGANRDDAVKVHKGNWPERVWIGVWCQIVMHGMIEAGGRRDERPL